MEGRMVENDDEAALLTMIWELVDPDKDNFTWCGDEDMTHDFSVWLRHKDDDLFIDIRNGSICINADGNDNVMISLSEPGVITKEKLDAAIKEFLFKPYKTLVSKVGELKKLMDRVESAGWKTLVEYYNRDTVRESSGLLKNVDEFVEQFEEIHNVLGI